MLTVNRKTKWQRNAGLTFASAVLRSWPQMTNMINKLTSLKAILRKGNWMDSQGEGMKSLNFCCFTMKNFSGLKRWTEEMNLKTGRVPMKVENSSKTYKSANEGRAPERSFCRDVERWLEVESDRRLVKGSRRCMTLLGGLTESRLCDAVEVVLLWNLRKTSF